MRCGEIDPVGPFARITFARDFEMLRGGLRVGSRQRVSPKPVASGWLLVVDCEHGFEMASRLVATPRQPGAPGFCQMLLDGFRRHARIDAERSKSVKRRARPGELGYQLL